LNLIGIEQYSVHTPVNVLMNKLGIKIVRKRIPMQRNVALQLWLSG